ncbi:MAG: CzcABC family efflux RND transporter, outer membrane protein [Nitrospira sp.]|nr:MAG: CzcABC family efflux RND transporter, outer membrane protein [Nitrospira sp.]
MNSLFSEFSRKLISILTVSLLGLTMVVPNATDLALAGEGPLSLSALIEELAARNPEVKAARERWDAAQAVVPQVQTLPDPRLQIGYQRMPMVPPVVEGAMYGIGQEIPFPGKLKLKGEVAQRDAERLEQEYNATRLRLVAALKQAYYDLHFIHKSIDIVERNKTLLTQFEKTAKARYSVGQAAQQDVFRAQVEISRVLDRLAVLDQQKESLHAAINRLLNRPPDGPLDTPEEVHSTLLTLPLQELNQRANEFSPALLATAKSIDRSERAVSLARRQFYPDFDVTALGIRNDKINDNGYQVMVGIKIPLFYESKQKQGVREALAGLEGAREDFAAARQDLLFQVKDGFVQAQRAERLITILRDAIIPQATLGLQAAQAGYAVGKVDFLTLLNSLLTLQDSQLELHSEMVNHEKALARLEAVTGGPLEGSKRKPAS